MIFITIPVWLFLGILGLGLIITCLGMVFMGGMAVFLSFSDGEPIIGIIILAITIASFWFGGVQIGLIAMGIIGIITGIFLSTQQ